MKKTVNQLRQMLGNARQPMPPQPVVIPDWPLDRRRLQAEQYIGLSAPEQAGSIQGTDETVTQRPLAGARPNNRGAGAILVAGDGTLNALMGRPMVPVTILELPKRSGEDAETMTFVCGVDHLQTSQDTRFPNAPINPSPIFPVQGFLEWGIGGITFNATFDWIQGTTFGLPASWARIRGAYSAVSEPIPLREPDIQLSAAVAYYPIGTRNLVKFTQFLGSIDAAATSPTQIVPNFATGFTVQSDTTTPNFRIDVSGGVGPGIFTASYVYDNATNAAVQDLAFPLAANERYLTVTNNGASSANVAIVYYLAF